MGGLTRNLCFPSNHLSSFVSEKSVYYTAILSLQLQRTFCHVLPVVAFVCLQLVYTAASLVVEYEVTRELGDSLADNLFSNSSTLLNINC